MSLSTKVAVAAITGVGIGALGTFSTWGFIKWWKSRSQCTVRENDLQSRPKRTDRKLTLYHSFPFRSSRCAWLVNELGAEEYVEFQHIKLHGTEAKDLLSYREIHPHGTLPCLMLEDGSVLLESSAICLYLAESFLGPEGQNLLPNEENTAGYYKYVHGVYTS